MPFFGGQLPPEIAALLNQQMQHQDHHRMAAEDYRHAVYTLFGEVSKEHLETLHSMFATLTMMPPEQAIGMLQYYEGLTAGKLNERFNICPACMTNHDEAAKELLNQQDDDGVKQPAPGSDPGPDPDEPTELTVADFENMREYGLDDVRDEDTLKLLGFKCLNCGMNYVSIEDRMKEPPGPEGCSGCRQKAKWG